jgi:cytosine/adenosine deaminase-related metal-dependent hydrolase
MATDIPANQSRVFRISFCFDGKSQFLRDCELFISHGIVRGVHERSDKSPAAIKLRQEFAPAEQIHVPHSIVLPGLINSHHHFYSTFARGLALNNTPQNFLEILHQLWWRLDRALDEESVALSAQIAVLDGLHHGCTAIVDHHSSPLYIRGSLQTINDALNPLHVSRVLSYECTDRNGPGSFTSSIAENLAFAEHCKAGTTTRALFGLHASFTLAEESLQIIAREKPPEMPVHVHVAEDRHDTEHAQSLHFSGALARLLEHELLPAKSIIVHAVHLTPPELDRLRLQEIHLAHCAESNANNRVGLADLRAIPKKKILLGTDGMSSNMMSSLRATYLLNSARGTPLSFAQLSSMLWENPQRYLAALFNRPIGSIEIGLPADFAIFSYDPPTPITADNLMAHLIFGLSLNARASWVYANGIPVIEKDTVITVDEPDLRDRARRCAERVWKNVAELPL